MVATETIDAEQQLQVRIIRTKGGIKNVAYIADNDTSLIVHQSTTSSASTASSTSSASSFSKHIVEVGEHEAFSDISQCELAAIPKLSFNTANIAHQNHFSKGYHSKDKSMQKVEFHNNEINVEVEVQKVHLIKQ